MTTPYWQTANFAPAPCLPCCAAPSGCMCALLIPPFASPYGSYADAQTAITDQTDGCIAYADYGGGDTGTSISASFDGTTITAAATSGLSSPGLALRVSVFLSVTLKSGATLTIPWTISTDGPATAASASLFYCADGTLADSDVIPPDAGPSGTLTLIAPADGEYVLKIEGGGTLGFTTFSNLSFTATCDMVYWVNPVIAQWDDSGTTRKLWACPKMLLPPLTESTGTWYASCADAAADIAAFAIDCIGYISCSPTTASRTATGGSSLAISGDATDAGPSFAPTVSGFGGFNALGGDTVSLAYAISSDDSIGTDYTVTVYDDTGVSVYSNSVSGGANISGTLTFTAPYSGRYSVQFFAEGSGNATTLTGSLNVTSSGTMSSNTIQARYDLGIDCPGTLNCGDACP